MLMLAEQTWYVYSEWLALAKVSEYIFSACQGAHTYCWAVLVLIGQAW